MNRIETYDVSDPREVAQKLATRISRLNESVARKARSVLKVRRICDPALFSRVYAVDSAYPGRPLDLVGLSLSLIAVVLVRHSNEEGTRIEYRRKLIVSYFSELEQDMIAALARKEERIMALKAIDDADLLVIDGEIVPYRGAKGHWRTSIHLSRELLEKAKELHVPVIGVIKRSYSNELATMLGLNINDKSIASLILRRGEYLELEPSLPILQEADCRIVFYKPLRGLSEAVKLEVCPSRKPVQLCQLVSYLSQNSGASGLPWIIDLVDSLSKQQISLLEAIRKMLLGKLAAQNMEGIVIGYPANPQERAKNY